MRVYEKTLFEKRGYYYFGGLTYFQKTAVCRKGTNRDGYHDSSSQLLGVLMAASDLEVVLPV